MKRLEKAEWRNVLRSALMLISNDNLCLYDRINIKYDYEKKARPTGLSSTKTDANLAEK
jgi:hypothetical protein